MLISQIVQKEKSNNNKIYPVTVSLFEKKGCYFTINTPKTKAGIREVLEREGFENDPVLLPHFSCHVLRHTFATKKEAGTCYCHVT